MEIANKSEKALEWEKLKVFLANEACSDWSRQMCFDLLLHNEVVLIQILLAETQEALSLLNGGFELSQFGLPELRPIILRLETGASLSTFELAQIRIMLNLAQKTKNSVGQLEAKDFQNLTNYAKSIAQLVELVNQIDKAIDKDGAIKNDASGRLIDLKNQIRRVNEKIKDELVKIINSSVQAKALQEPLYTERNGRYVLPVNVSMRNLVDGLVHDTSNSGLTVYIEPYAVVELSNQIRLLEGEIELEIARILSALTELAKKDLEAIERTYTTLVELDFIAARARLAKKYKGICPQIASSGATKIKQGKHPLLILQDSDSGKNIIGNDIELADNKNTLIITGPNTGGKTVLLKSIGLIALMVKAGLLIPADNGSQVKIYKNIYADIGDEQSLEESLSTFSAHIANIVEIISKADQDTLILLDEVGAGTDPKEGTALARAILEYLTEQRSHIIASTHFGELKTLAHSQSGFVNASFEFDEKTLSPTYRLLAGLAGNSCAFEIAGRIGLKQDLINRAISLYESSSDDVNKTVELLQKQLSELAQQKAELQNQIVQTQENERQAENLLKEIDQYKSDIRLSYANQMESQFGQAAQILKEMIAELQKSPDMKKAQESQRKIESIKNELGWLDNSLKSKAGSNEPLHLGQYVKVLSLNKNGIIEKLPEKPESNDKAQALVRVDNIKIKVSISDLVASQLPNNSQKNMQKSNKIKSINKETKIKFDNFSTNTTVFVRTENNSLDLRGERVDQGINRLQQFVDNKVYEKTSPIMVIHGHGTGALRLAVRSYLSDSAYKLKYREGESYEGGNGVTIIEFED